jgi:hypothetical protein
VTPGKLLPRRSAAIVIAAAVLALPAAACSGGGGPSSAGSGGSPAERGSANSPSAIGFSRCVRSHGVPNFPDPPGGGGLPKASARELGVSTSRLLGALTACQRLIPATGGAAKQQEQQCFPTSDCPPAVVQELLNVMLRFARCMRTHGVPNFPDPGTDSQGQPFFDVSAQGISDRESHSPQFTAKLNACQRRTGNFPYSFG